MDTIIYALSGLLNNLPPSIMACGMFILQDVLNVLVPSGSGRAAVTMPLMAPLSDMLGVTRQTAVLAFQMGSTFYRCAGAHQRRNPGGACHVQNALRKMDPVFTAAVLHVVPDCLRVPYLCGEDRIRTILTVRLVITASAQICPACFRSARSEPDVPVRCAISQTTSP